jgi:Protease inhibitor Inh
MPFIFAPQHTMAFRLAALPAIVCASLLVACSGSDRTIFGGGSDNPLPASAPAPAGPAAKPPPVNLAGRWTLSATGSSSCAITFGAGSPDATEGTIAPAGGCPFNFFTSRKWIYTEAGLTLRDHTAQALAQLSPAGPNRFEGRTGAGQDVALSR